MLPNKVLSQGFFLFFIKASFWAVITYFLAKKFAVGNFWIVVFSVFLFSIPMALCGIYGNTICQIRRLHLFVHHGLLFMVLNGRLLRVIFWICWALATSFFVLIQFHTYNRLEWFVFFLVIPVFWSVFSICRWFIGGELKAYLVNDMALMCSRWLCPPIMLAIYALVTLYLGVTPVYFSFQETLNSQMASVADMNGSALVREFSYYMAFHDGIKALAMGRLAFHDTIWAAALMGIGAFLVFYNACVILSCFVIPGVEYRRIFGPLSESDPPAPVPLSRIIGISFFTMFSAFLVFLSVFVYLEAWVRQTPEMGRIRQNAESWVIPRLEQIDDAFFREGTLAKLQDAEVNALHRVDAALIHLDNQIDQAFDRLEANVDGYLDWYYSLAGEYSRIASLMAGELEQFMIVKLEQSLQETDAFREVQTALNNAIAVQNEALIEYRRKAQNIIRQNRIDPGSLPFNVVKNTSMAKVFNPPQHHDIIAFQSRLLAGGSTGAAAGIAAAVIIQRIIGKTVSNNILKPAAKALARVAVSRTTGTAGAVSAGAAAGAAIGSFIPGPGTAIGAAAGGIFFGLAVGVTVDKMLLMLEESLNREKFKDEILSAIDETRMEFKPMLNRQ
ncbi:MAG: hypothetical protein R6U27_08065 [Desulfobacterales bacterium]